MKNEIEHSDIIQMTLRPSERPLTEEERKDSDH